MPEVAMSVTAPLTLDQIDAQLAELGPKLREAELGGLNVEAEVTAAAIDRLMAQRFKLSPVVRDE